jgi:hypothetical protein
MNENHDSFDSISALFSKKMAAGDRENDKFYIGNRSNNRNINLEFMSIFTKKRCDLDKKLLWIPGYGLVRNY